MGAARAVELRGRVLLMAGTETPMGDGGKRMLRPASAWWMEGAKLMSQSGGPAQPGASWYQFRHRDSNPGRSGEG